MPHSHNVEALRQYAVIFVVVGVTFAIGLNILADIEPQLTQSLDVTNETFNATSDPFLYEVSTASDSNFRNLTTAQAYDTLDRNTELTTEVFNSTHVRVNSTVDTGLESLDYTYEADDEDAQSGVNEAVNAILTFTQWLGLIALIVVAGIIIRHVTGFGRQASGARGRA